jgi:hypothetical protein
VDLIDKKTECQRERQLKEIALRFIPEELEGEYEVKCPHGQPVYEPSSPIPCKYTTIIVMNLPDWNSDSHCSGMQTTTTKGGRILTLMDSTY